MEAVWDWGCGGPAALWAQQGLVGVCSRNAFASNLTFSQSSAVLINRFSEELKGKCAGLMRGVSFPQAWGGVRMQPVLEGCVAWECSKDGEVQPPWMCSAVQTRPPTPDTPRCTHISAPCTSPLTPAHLLQALLYPRG